MSTYLSNHFDHQIDARGLSCPLPILNTPKSLDFLKPGEVVKILATDRGAKSFFESLARQTGLELLAWREDHEALSFFLKKL